MFLRVVLVLLMMVWTIGTPALPALLRFVEARREGHGWRSHAESRSAMHIVVAARRVKEQPRARPPDDDRETDRDTEAAQGEQYGGEVDRADQSNSSMSSARSPDCDGDATRRSSCHSPGMTNGRRATYLPSPDGSAVAAKAP